MMFKSMEEAENFYKQQMDDLVEMGYAKAIVNVHKKMREAYETKNVEDFLGFIESEYRRCIKSLEDYVKEYKGS